MDENRSRWPRLGWALGGHWKNCGSLRPANSVSDCGCGMATPMKFMGIGLVLVLAIGIVAWGALVPGKKLLAPKSSKSMEAAKSKEVEELPDLSGVLEVTANPKVILTLPEWAVPFRPQYYRVSSSDIQVVRSTSVLPEPLGERQLSLTIIPTGVGYSHLHVTLRDGVHTKRFGIHYAASASERAGGYWHLGASDGSAALAIDSGWMVVGDDEDQTLRLYARDQNGPAAAKFDMNPFLGLTDLHHNGKPKEIDIEAAVRQGNQLYWVGSESHDRAGQPALNRGRLFRTDLVGTGKASELQFIGRYDYLLQDLIHWDASNVHRRGTNFFGLTASAAPGVPSKEPSGEGFVIEGVCRAVGDPQTAWLAFRAPLVPPDARWKALIVPVTNFFVLAASGDPEGSARFGAPIQLDLGGRGVRDVMCDGTNVLIVAGPPGRMSPSLPHDFRMFTWDGNPVHPPELRLADLTGLHPEAIVELPPAPWTENSTVQLVSDCGTMEYYGDGVLAKDLHSAGFKKFRSDVVKLGPVVTR